jgi:hypothetical protein
VDRAVRAARAAFEDGPWPRASAGDRALLISRLADLVEANAGELAELESLDNGKPLKLAKIVDVAQTVAQLRYFSGWSERVFGATIPVRQPPSQSMGPRPGRNSAASVPSAGCARTARANLTTFLCLVAPRRRVSAPCPVLVVGSHRSAPRCSRGGRSVLAGGKSVPHLEDRGVYASPLGRTSLVRQLPEGASPARPDAGPGDDTFATHPNHPAPRLGRTRRKIPPGEKTNQRRLLSEERELL